MCTHTPGYSLGIHLAVVGLASACPTPSTPSPRAQPRQLRQPRPTRAGSGVWLGFAGSGAPSAWQSGTVVSIRRIADSRT